MPIQAIVSDINTVDEAQRGFYVEKDGKFVLDVAPVDGFALENVDGLKAALSAERARAEDANRKLKPYEGLDVTAARSALEAIGLYGDITPQKAKEALEAAERLSKIDPEKEADRLANEKLEAAKQQLTSAFSTRETELTTQLTAAQQANAALTTQIETLMVDNVITAELAKLKPVEGADEALMLLAKQAIKPRQVDGKIVVEVVDAQGNAQIKEVANGQVVYKTPADYLAELRAQKPALFQADQINGLGTKPNSKPGNGGHEGPNPWAKDTFNLTQQMKLQKENPTLAKQLKAAAGSK